MIVELLTRRTPRPNCTIEVAKLQSRGEYAHARPLPNSTCSSSPNTGGILIWLAIALGIAALAYRAVVAANRRQLEHMRPRDEVWETLASKTVWNDAPFDELCVERLPNAARRYFSFAIAAGTPLRPVAVVATKSLRRGARWHCHTLLAAPHGMQERGLCIGWLVSRLRQVDAGTLVDEGWSFLGLFSDRRKTQETDLLSEMLLRAVLWTPAALLSGEMRWIAISDHSACVELVSGQRTSRAEIVIDDDGRLISVRTGDKIASIKNFRDVEGYNVPIHLDIGNERVELVGLRYVEPWAGSSHS